MDEWADCERGGPSSPGQAYPARPAFEDEAPQGLTRGVRGRSPWYVGDNTPHHRGTDRRGPTPPGGAVTLGAWQSSMYPKS